jgi:hypothetical protein
LSQRTQRRQRIAENKKNQFSAILSLLRVLRDRLFISICLENGLGMAFDDPTQGSGLDQFIVNVGRGTHSNP